jgi:four helix bundle protein
MQNGAKHGGAGVERKDLQERTRQFALRVVRLVEALPRARSADVLGRQLLRCGTSVGANYRAACRSQSPADFIAKMHIVQEEADEAAYWMALLADAAIVPASRLTDLIREADELVAISVASINTARRNARNRKGRDK